MARFLKKSIPREVKANMEMPASAAIFQGILSPSGAIPVSGNPGVVVGVAEAAHEELLTVVFLKVIAAVWAITLPASVAPPPVKSIDAEARTVPTNCVVPSNVAEEPTVQKTLQA